MNVAMRVVAAILGAALWFATTAAQAAPASTEADAALLRQLSQEWSRAIEQKDRATLERLLAPEFSLQAPGEAERIGREEWLGNAISMDWSHFRFENLVVNVDGDRALVTSILYFRVGPLPITWDSGVMDVWTRRSGQWQATHRYLGESKLRNRMSFAAGFGTASAIAVLWWLLARLMRRRRGGLR